MTTRRLARWATFGVGSAASLALVAWLAASGEDRPAPGDTAPAVVAAPALADGDCCDGPGAAPVSAKKRVLRISADPNNLPFTNERRQGFENKIADLLAADLGAELAYTWRAERRGFFRQSLQEGECDLVLGVPAGFDLALTTAPYYRSTYVFVSRKDRRPGITSLDDPALKKLRIGVQMIGNDGTNTPPAHALARRGIIDNVEGFMIYGDYQEENPPARVIEAVAKGNVDVAVAWGPMAGYFAKRQPVDLELTPVKPEVDPPGLRFVFAIAMGVRKDDKKLRDEVDGVLKRRKAEIDRILDEYGVPRVAGAPPKPEKSE